MPIPDYQMIMMPLLKFLGDKKEHSFSEAVEHITKVFSLTDEERRKLLPSGNEAVIHNRSDGQEPTWGKLDSWNHPEEVLLEYPKEDLTY